MKKLLPLVCILAFAAVAHAQTDRPTLLQKPALSKTHIAFAYAGDLWIVSRSGGEATRLTNGVGVETDPAFSPDGSMIAFTGQYDGNIDVFVIPAAGGVPRRLTFHPDPDEVVGVGGLVAAPAPRPQGAGDGEDDRGCSHGPSVLDPDPASGAAPFLDIPMPLTVQLNRPAAALPM